MAIWWSLSVTGENPANAAFTPSEPANSPMGVGKGIHPGRVAWVRDTAATNWDGSTGSWWDDDNTDQDVVDYMVSKSIQTLTGEPNDPGAWDALFRHFNQTKGFGDIGYQAGERIAIKINKNEDDRQTWSPGRGVPSPHVIYSFLDQLINVVGVPGSAITVYDASRYIGDPIFDKVRSNPDPNFQSVTFVVKSNRAGNGRIAASPDGTNPVYTKGGTAYLPTCVTGAKYLINMALLRPHTLYGITLCAKNHFGSTYFSGSWTPSPLHDYGGRGQAMDTYNCLVNLNGHRHLAGKTLLYMIDSLYPSRNQNPSNGYVIKYQSFGDDWFSSLLVSQDPVAIDSVGLDFMRNEPRCVDVTGYPENYLHEMAQADNPPSGTVYDPERDGIPLESMGVHEHWNNPVDRQYSRNLETGDGIELVVPTLTSPEGPVENVTKGTRYDYIRHAIDDADPGDEIVASPGIYKESIDFAGKNLMVRSTDPNDPAVVAATVIKSNSDAVTFSGGEDASCVLAGFTITSGKWGVYCSDATPTITSCRIVDSGSAGIKLWNESNLAITNCVVAGNGGAGIEMLESRAGRFVKYNWATITNCNIVGNQEQGVYGSNPIVANCCIVGNGQNGIFCLTPTVTNSIIYYNGRSDGIAQIAAYSSDVVYSNVQGAWPGIGNIDVEPGFVSRGSWDPNGTLDDPSDDFWVDGDFHLKSQAGRWDPLRADWVQDAVTSLCIDAGNPGCVPGSEPLPNGNRINMGAYGGTNEASASPADWRSVADLTNDNAVDGQDLATFAKFWSDGGVHLPADFDRDGEAGFTDLVILAEDWLTPEQATGQLGKPGLAKYYAPYDNPVEPNAPGYSLPLDLAGVSNYGFMDSKFDLGDVAPLLEQNGFAIIEYDPGSFDPNRDDIVKPYEYLSKRDVPLFVTVDTLLHLYHIQFDETLKDIEEREFVRDINDLTTVLLDDALAQYEEYSGELKEAAKRNVAFLAVAQKLIQPEAQVPPLVADAAASELAKIDAHEGFAASDIFIYMEDYSQYVPRGHYTRSGQLKRYFRTLMWYGRMTFLLKGSDNWGPMGEALISVEDAKIQTMQAVLLAKSIEKVQVGQRTGREVWDRMYAVTSFYVGLADDLTPYEYLWAVHKVFGGSFVATELADEEMFFALKVELALLRSPKIYGGTGKVWVMPPITSESLDEVLDKTKGMRFMGQRFIPDSYMFQHLVTPKVRDYTGDGNPIPFSYGTTPMPVPPHRCYPRGLDVMAILGSARAKTILVQEGDTDFVDYWLRFDELKAEFDAFDISDWNRNLYWGWLYSLRSLIDEFGQGYPNFMLTEAWEKKELNAALASWTELRHDTILYAKQSYTPPPPGPPPSLPPGYVEPVPEFYGRLLALTRMTREGLSDLDALSTEAAERLVNLEGILSRLIEIANKELMNQALSEDDCRYIKGLADRLERTIVGVEEKGVKTTLVADVHTYSYEGKVVEEGVGYVDLIIVACPLPDGSIMLAAGPVLSYYEFKHPMSDRLTDEAWRQMLDSAQRPDRPAWYFQPASLPSSSSPGAR